MVNKQQNVNTQTNKQTNTNKQTASMLVASGVQPVGVTTVSVPTAAPFGPGKPGLPGSPFLPWQREKKGRERERERDSEYFVYLDSSDCLTVVPLEPLDPAAPLDPCMQRYTTLFNLSSLVMTNFFSSPSFRLFLSSLLLRAVPWGPCSPSDLEAPLSQ